MSESTIPENHSSIICSNLLEVQRRVQESAIECGRKPSTITLIAVSKTKPAEDILALYHAGHRDFGENYYQELVEKAEILPKDIRWHFIGHLQSSKAPKIIREIPNLYCLHTVDSMKLASKLNSSLEKASSTLNILLQVRTSEEDTKSGVSPDELIELSSQIQSECGHLRIRGVMTIGAPGDLSCFRLLSECRERLANQLGVDSSSLDLSMGMSGDFEEAISCGATFVRVGSTIFGPRIYPKK